MELKLMAIVMIFWAGMVAAISFLESWVKFRTPSLKKAVGLDVGRTVFGFFNKVQAVLMVLSFALAFYGSSNVNILISIYLLTFIVVSQNIWLFPILAKRVTVIMRGDKPKPSKIHAMYGMLEVLKLMLLVGVGCYILII